jgi:Tol biopolymer transport system component
MKYSQKSHSSAGYHNMIVVLFTLLCVLIGGSLALSPKAQTKTSDEHVTPKTVPGRNGKIVFSSNRDGNYEICTMEADGSNVQRLTNNPAYDSGPKWSPDGTKIAFTSNRDDSSVGCTSGGVCKSEIYVMNADGTNQTRTNNPVFQDFDWSPDSTRIVFESYSMIRFPVNISVMNADGSNVQRLTNFPGFDLSPKWSPDGTKIAFVRTEDFFEGAYNISVMNADGTNQTRFSDHFGYGPRWSPDGTKIVFVKRFESSDEIYVMNTDGSNGQRLTNNTAYDSTPEWSPDGAKITFIRCGGSNGFGCSSTTSYIWVVNADGSNQTRLTDSPVGNFSSIFSPDSAKIAFISFRDNGSDIYVMNADGSNPVRLTNTAAGVYNFQLDWQALPLTSPSCPNPIDCAEFFVRQHYLDFLGREPDPPGLAFWTNEITLCGSDAQCVESKRVNVSAAFFLSIEFQETGYLVYKTYSAAFGPTRIASTVPLTRSEFLPDVQSVAQGVVVGATGWKEQLEANQTAYFNEFVQRPNFVATYPPTMNSAQYVDSLNANASGALSSSERDQLVQELSSGAKTRAQVLRAVAENQEFTRAHFNRAFVLMQYFGYLRRNPNDAPDANFDGYSFWLAKLNQFNGNYEEAEMVKAFLVSIEYRQRFGQP